MAPPKQLWQPLLCVAYAAVFLAAIGAQMWVFSDPSKFQRGSGSSDGGRLPSRPLGGGPNVGVASVLDAVEAQVVADPPSRPRVDPHDPEITTFWKNEAMAERARTVNGVTRHYPNETIFISIASFGDSECAPTISRAFKRAVYPDRIFIGLFQQHNCTGEEGNAPYCRECEGDFYSKLRCPEHPACGRIWQIRASRLHMSETLGVTYGRYMSESKYQNETYIMNIDAHSQFVHGWDSVQIDMFKRIGDDYAVLSTYPTGYPASESGFESENFVVPNPNPTMCICITTRMNTHGITHTWRHAAGSFRLPKKLHKPVRSAFLAGGYNFARGHRHAACPYDPYSPFIFDGEELSFGARLWSHGYDLYHPDVQVVAHLYATPGLRPAMWQFDWEKRREIQKRSNLRLNYIIGLHDEWDPKVPVESLDLREIERFGAGKVRPIREFFNWAKLPVDPKLPKHSESLCAQYEAGGMPLYPRNWSAKGEPAG